MNGYIEKKKEMKNKILKKENFYLLVATFIFILFFYISYKTPLAGDDWGYYLNGTKGNPILMAVDFYFSWSGRFFSELWGFVITHHKMLWNIINALLFCLIFVGIYKIAHVEKKIILIPLIILACILSVDDHLRMETYSWIMGTTYVVPLCLSIWYFYIAEKIFETNIKDKKFYILFVISNIFLLIIGLMMENIAAAMVFATIVLSIYTYFNKRKNTKYFIINGFVSLSAFIIMRMSPGSNYRLFRDNAIWANQNIFEKITNAFPTFIEKTFLDNNYLILILSLSIILLLIFSNNKSQKYKYYKYPAILIQLIAIFEVFSFALPFINRVPSGSDVFSLTFWPIYTVITFLSLFVCIENSKRKDKAIFYFMIAGTCSLVMLMSPIYGSRSSLYTVFYIILVIVLIIEMLPIKKMIIFIIMLGFIYIIGDRTFEYLYKYKLVGDAYRERVEIINYYIDHPEVEEVWIPRFPIYTVHGSDIEPDDYYHLEVFKYYFNLPQDPNKIYFYYKQ